MIFVIFIKYPLPDLPPRGKEVNHFPLGGNKKGGFIFKKVNSFFCCLFIICFSFQSPAQKKIHSFTDVTTRSGIDFKYTFGDYSYKNILESSGSGITVFDYNNDNLMDLFMMNGTYIEGVSDQEGKKFSNTPDRLYKNNGNGKFTEVSKSAGLDDRNWSMAAGAIDYDNDGDQDLYLLNYGPNVFYRNNGNGTFADITTNLGPQEVLKSLTDLSNGASAYHSGIITSTAGSMQWSGISWLSILIISHRQLPTSCLILQSIKVRRRCCMNRMPAENLLMSHRKTTSGILIPNAWG